MRNQFTGTWKLLACEFRKSDGQIDSPFGHDALGTIIYDASGNMAVQIIRADCPKFVSGDKYNGTPEELMHSRDELNGGSQRDAPTSAGGRGDPLFHFGSVPPAPPV